MVPGYSCIAAARAMQQPCSNHAHGPCCLTLLAAGCYWLMLLLLRRLVESLKNFFFKKKLKNFFEKKSVEFFGDTLSRIVIDHKNRPPPPAPRTLKLNTTGVADLTNKRDKPKQNYK
jgi:hypothetical protein